MLGHINDGGARVREESLRVFAYGSLMWDGWEHSLGGTRNGKGLLLGYRRSFCIVEASGRWGTTDVPGLVLGLVPDATAKVEGILFRLPGASRDRVAEYLRDREGPHHIVAKMQVRVASNRYESVAALVAISLNDSDAFVGHLPLTERVKQVLRGKGTVGTSIHYVLLTQDRLVALDIHDPEVEAFRAAVLRAQEEST